MVEWEGDRMGFAFGEDEGEVRVYRLVGVVRVLRLGRGVSQAWSFLLVSVPNNILRRRLRLVVLFCYAGFWICDKLSLIVRTICTAGLL